MLKRLFILSLFLLGSSLAANPTTFVLVRHVQTTDNANDIWSGTRRDPELSDLGKGQVKELTKTLLEKYPHPDVIIIAPYARARETIQLYAKETGITPVESPDALNEADHGSLTGLTYEQREGLKTEGLSPEELKAIAAWKKSKDIPYEEEYEDRLPNERCPSTYKELSGRLVDHLKKLSAQYPGKTVILVVAGGGPINALRRRAWEQDRTKSRPQNTPNGFIFEVQGTSDYVIVDGVKLQ